jgi:HEAT repeat protein
MSFLKRLFAPKKVLTTPALLDLLDAGTPKEVAGAFNELAGRSGTMNAAEREQLGVAARRAAQDARDEVRGQAMFALGELGGDTDLLMRGLEDTNWFVRLVSVSALFRRGVVLPQATLQRLRNDPDPLVQEAAADYPV